MTTLDSMGSAWYCCGDLMYMARSERDDEGTPVHSRRCRACGRKIETEERILRAGSYRFRATSARRRDQRYERYESKQCRVCNRSYMRGRYGRHIPIKEHQRALARRRAENHWKQVETQRRYRERQAAA